MQKLCKKYNQKDDCKPKAAILNDMLSEDPTNPTLIWTILSKGSKKEEITSQVFVTEKVRLHWMLSCDLHYEAKSLQLPQDAIEV